ncbi:beta-microseminoprotein-like isoform X2 [Heterodontus francisci]|uniref:beta-microseminoprotein-like isoform X2 n=1 Tax=Heterodontus francisci TaxID=7792 RepID=UPI00355AF159
MNVTLCLVLLLTAFALLESAVKIYSKNSGRCKDHTDRTMHNLGSKWRNSDCQICKCLHTVVACWDVYSTPTSYPDDCIAVFERENCRYRVQKRNNPAIVCKT